MQRGIRRSERTTQVTVILPISDVNTIEKLVILRKFSSLGSVVRESISEFLKTEAVQKSLDEYDRIYGYKGDNEK